MARNLFLNKPEVFKPLPEEQYAAQSAEKAGAIRRLRQGLYTTNTTDPLADVVRRNRWHIVGILCPGAVISHRTAIELVPTEKGTVFVTSTYERVIKDIPGLRIRQMKGPGPLPDDRPYVSGLHISSEARAYLECLSGRPKGSETPFLNRKEVEARLERLIAISEPRIASIRDGARRIQDDLDARPAFEALQEIIGRLYGTQDGLPETPAGLARAEGRPYDSHRVSLFETLFRDLANWLPTSRPDDDIDSEAFRNIAFYDAYFSNYIEGTEFEVDEALDIVIEGRIPARRPKDAHDVLGTYNVVSDIGKMTHRVSEQSFEEFRQQLLDWHALIMAMRPDKLPGSFKQEGNRVGTTVFVSPALVEGTLREGFEMGRGLGSAFGRAAFLMFLIAEVHPFADGNGRIARAVANAELVSHGERRLIIPTVYRIEYLDALRLLSQDGDPRNLARMLDRAQEFSASIDFHDLNAARAQLTAWNAFEQGLDAHLRRPRS